MEKRLLILGFVFVITALGGCITKVQESPADTTIIESPDDITIIDSNESPPEKIALRIAWEAVKKTGRYTSWKAEGVEYEAVPRPSYAQDDVNYKPELWTVDFGLPYVEDQDMYVMVDINTGTVLYLHEYAA
ncbi:MAG: hypothetical protein AABW99_04975 [archaeon]